MKITEQEIFDAVNSSQSMRQAASKLPINFKTFRTYAIKLNLYKPNPSGKGLKKIRPSFLLENILIGKHPQYHTWRLKNRLISEMDWEPMCSVCKHDSWLDKPIPLELDHIDGNPYNHLLNNLRLLCPNCHAQTPTYRNKIRPR